jgi:aminobenzoyl-glutamate utilization protein B
VRAFEDETLIRRARADLEARLEAHPYVCPVPADVKPPLDMASV